MSSGRLVSSTEQAPPTDRTKRTRLPSTVLLSSDAIIHYRSPPYPREIAVIYEQKEDFLAMTPTRLLQHLESYFYPIKQNYASKVVKGNIVQHRFVNSLKATTV